jgi:hypothetical protein
MTRLAEVAITGVALWSPRLPGWDLARDVALGRASAPAAPLPRPAPALLAPTERRRAPDTVALALEVASRACQMAGVEPRDVPSVFASTFGDLPINDYMCATLATTPTLCSPTKFHNSVHNAAAGYWTIGTGSQRPSTALLAGPATFAAGLLEATCQVLVDLTPVLLVAYDVGSRGPLATVTRSEGLLAAGLVLAPLGRGPEIAHLSCSLATDAADPAPAAPLPAGWTEALPANAMNACLPLFAALATAARGRLGWTLGSGSRLEVELTPLAGPPPCA